MRVDYMVMTTLGGLEFTRFGIFLVRQYETYLQIPPHRSCRGIEA